jgi:uncharacterized secreted protein with C-terminal beta-propeller domain
MYITKDRLILICERDGAMAHPLDLGRSAADYGCIVYPGEYYRTDTSVTVYDVSDKARPEPIETLTQSGWYVNSRMIGDQLYLISSYSEFYADDIDKSEPRTFVPNFVEGNNQTFARPDDITLLPDAAESVYTVVSGINTKNARFTDHESVFGGNPLVYSSKDNLYLAMTKGSEEERSEGDLRIYTYSQKTELARLSLREGHIETEAQAEVAGLVDDQFSMDEYEGVFRIIATDEVWIDAWNEATEQYYYSDEELDEDDADSQLLEDILEEGSRQTTTLYTLDMDLSELARIGDLAPDEVVYSSRFMGDIGYFVTFRQTDPLFSVDLSDPKNPVILGELKIPGFSEYLQGWDDHLLFGFGKDADEDTGAVTSLKLKMFDVRDPSDVKEHDTLLLKDLLYSEASYNHKAILADPGKGIIAFPTDEGKYIICSYSAAGGFKRIVDINISKYADDYDSWYASIRGLFIGDLFYVVSERGIFTYDMTDGFKNVERMLY